MSVPLTDLAAVLHARQTGEGCHLEVAQSDAAAAFTSAGEGVRWPLLFFAIWARIHLESASPTEALESVVGAI